MEVIDNFSSSFTKFLDDRQKWADLDTLKANTSTLMPNGFQAFCVAEGKWYQLSCTDEKDTSTYSWQASGSGDEVESKLSDALTNLQTNKIDKIIADANYFTSLSNGNYFAIGENEANSPNDGSGLHEYMTSIYNGCFVQTCYSQGTGNIFVRSGTMSNMSSWKQLMSASHLYQHNVVIRGADKNGDDFWFYMSPFYTTSADKIQSKKITEGSSSADITEFNKIMNELPNGALGTDNDFNTYTSMSKYNDCLIGHYYSDAAGMTKTIWESGNWNIITEIEIAENTVKQIF